MKKFFRLLSDVCAVSTIIVAITLVALAIGRKEFWNTQASANAFVVTRAPPQLTSTLEPPNTPELTATTEPTVFLPEVTPTTAPTLWVQKPLEDFVITVVPTLPVPTRLLNEEFAMLHIPAEQMSGVYFKTVIRAIVIEPTPTEIVVVAEPVIPTPAETGTTVPAVTETEVVVVTEEVPVVTNPPPVLTGNDMCNGFTKRDAVAVVYLMSRRFGQSFRFTGPLIGSESAFIFYEFDGPNGECVANQNNAGAPAYCAGQIYQPRGAGGQTHPEFDLYPTGNEPRASLQDPVYCMAASMKVYAYDFGGNSILAAANYKGFGSAYDSIFVNNYMPWYNAGAVTVDGVTIPFVDDYDRIHSILGPEIDKWEASIDDFYRKMPGFYGH